MKTHTSAFKNNIKTFGRELDSFITYTIDGTDYELGMEQLNSVTPHYESTILKSVMKQLDIDSDVDIPIGTVINYQFGVKTRYNDEEDYRDNYDYVNFGNYVVYSSEKQEDTKSYKIICYDKMLYTMKEYEALPISYPITIRNFISAICTKVGLTFKNASDEFANYDKEIASELFLSDENETLGYTYRDVLDQLAQVTASTICINEEDDELEIRYIQSGTSETLLTDIELNTNISGGAFLLDTTGYTTQQLTNGVNGFNTIASFTDENQTRGYLVCAAEGAYIPSLAQEWGVNVYKPDGTAFGDPEAYDDYMFWVEMAEGGSFTGLYINYDLSTKTNYGSLNIEQQDILLTNVETSHFDESAIWDCMMISISEIDTIDEEYFKNINVNFGEKYGPVNSIVLSRADEADSVYLQDEDSVAENGLCEIKIKENIIMNFNDRSDYLQDILDQLDGLEYYVNDYSSTGICYYNMCDRYNAKIGENTYNCIMFNDEVLVTQGLEENIHAEILDESVTDYTKADKTDRKINQTYIIADKANQQITSAVLDIENLNGTVSELGTTFQQDKENFEYQITQLNNTVSETTENLQEQIDEVSGIPEQLQNTLVTININGITVATNLSKVSTIVTNNTFAVQDNYGNYLTYIGYDEIEGRSKAEMDNLTVTNFFMAGVHRQQVFEIDSEERTGWFYLGGS